MQHRNIQIPIVIPPERRTDLRELLLFVSNNQGKSWDLAAFAKPEHSAFVFHAPSDGQYWFKVQAVYQGGNREPADIYAASINMKVLIDSQQQLLRIITAERTGDEVYVAWEMTGTPADLMSLKLEYRVADQGPNLALATGAARAGRERTETLQTDVGGTDCGQDAGKRSGRHAGGDCERTPGSGDECTHVCTRGQQQPDHGRPTAAGHSTSEFGQSAGDRDRRSASSLSLRKTCPRRFRRRRRRLSRRSIRPHPSRLRHQQRQTLVHLA